MDGVVVLRACHVPNQCPVDLLDGVMNDHVLLGQPIDHGCRSRCCRTCSSQVGTRKSSTNCRDGDIHKWQGEMVSVDFDGLLECVNESRDYLAEASGYSPGILD